MSDPTPRALYAGTFDPMTLGHLDLIRRGVKLFGSLLVAVAENRSKEPLFTPEERVQMIRDEVRDLPVEVVRFDGLVVDEARNRGISILLRGVRTFTDFEYEYPMAMTNRRLNEEIESVFVMPSELYAYVSSRLIKEVYAGGGEIQQFLPPAIHTALKKRLNPESES
ncbi:MAG: pantetheine-phosphate adenylyltransferase [Planctomycetota bacterium]|nr:pantetheine-phosphate adenylyltransferase [Planctomycetota bacterium]